MKPRLAITTGLMAALALSVPALATDIDEYADSDDKSLETCLKVAVAVFGGRATSVEYKMEDGDPIYDFDIRADDGLVWEIECNAENGMISEIEREVAKDDPLFSKQAKVSETAARETALAIFPGKIDSVEYGVEADGSAAYEFDIILSSGGQMNVEVDATTGKITEANPELWEIGED